MTPMIRTALTHLGTALGAAVATGLFLATKSVDLYAVFDQINVVVTEVTKLVALVTPLITGAYAVWRATTKNKIEDIQQDDRVKGIITTPELAGQLGPKVQTNSGDLPDDAKFPPLRLVG